MKIITSTGFYRCCAPGASAPIVVIASQNFCLETVGRQFLPRGINGPHPQYGWDFPEETPENSGKTPETLSERFLEFPSRVRLGCPKPYNSRHLRLPEHFQNSLPPSTAGDAFFFWKWFWRGPLRAGHGIFPAVLGVFLNQGVSQGPLGSRGKPIQNHHPNGTLSMLP